MVAFTRQSLIGSLPLYGAFGVGLATAAAFLLMPADLIEAIVWRSGIASLVPVTAPPIGITARAILAIGIGGLLGTVAWSALYLVFGPGGWLAEPKRREDGMPNIRRADAHPDAPPRKPLSAADLGEPMMAPAGAGVVATEDAALPIPADLDLPLAAFDPDALLPVPMEPARPVAPLAPAVQVVASERIETFELTPLVRSAADAREEPRSAQTIEMLLRRLEEGAGRRRSASAH